MGQHYPNNMVQKIDDLAKLVANELLFSKDRILSSWTDEDNKKIADDITNRYRITDIDSPNFQHTAISLIWQTMSLIASAYQQHSSLLSSGATIRQSIEQEIQTALTQLDKTPYAYQLVRTANANSETVWKEIFDAVVHDNTVPSQLEIKEAVQAWIKKNLTQIENTTTTPQSLNGIQNDGIYETSHIDTYRYPNDGTSYLDKVNKILTQTLSYYKSASGEYATFDVVWNINSKLFELKKYQEYARYYYQVYTKDSKIVIDLLDPLQILKNTHIEKPLFYSQNPVCVQTSSIYSNPESMNSNIVKDPFEKVPENGSNPEKQVKHRTSNLGYIFPETEKRYKRILNIIKSLIDEEYDGIATTVISGFLNKTDVKNLSWALTRLRTLGYIQTSPSQTKNKFKYSLTTKGLEYISRCKPVQLCWTKWFKQQFSNAEFQQFVKPILFEIENVSDYCCDWNVGAIRKLVYGGIIEFGKKATLTDFGKWIRDQYLKEQERMIQIYKNQKQEASSFR